MLLDNLERVLGEIIGGRRHLARRIHAHLELSRQSKGPYLSIASRVVFITLLLVTRGKFKSTAASYLTARASICRLTPQQITIGLLRDHRLVIEVIEHQVHILLRLCGQVGAMQVFIIFVNGYADATLGYIASRPRSFWYFFRIMKFGSATTSLPIATPLILKWQRRWLLTVHYGTGR